MALQPLDKIRAEHFALAQLIRELEESLQLRHREDSAGARARGVLELLERFDRALREHFVFEEKEGYFSEILAVAPRLARRVARLQDHHAEYRERSRMLVEMARKVSSESGWIDLQSQSAALLTALREHEREEDALVREAFMDDLGRGD